MKVRVLATAPFCFPLRGPSLFFFSAGDSTILETSEPESRRHLLDLLGPDYADYVYIDRELLPEDLLQEVLQSGVGEPVEQTEVIPVFKHEEPVAPLPAPLEEPAQEPPSFQPVVEEVETSLPAPVEEYDPVEQAEAEPVIPEVVEPEALEDISEEQFPLEDVAPVEETVEPVLEEVAPPTEGMSVDQLLEHAIAARKAELDELHWTQLREVGEPLGISYTNKAETIEAIIAKEFE